MTGRPGERKLGQFDGADHPGKNFVFPATCCVDDCNIECGSDEEVACVGPDFGPYDIGENERCCICIDPNENYAD